MKLALKKAAPKELLPKLFYFITKYRLVTKYPHAGIVVDGKLYHANLSNGLHEQYFSHNLEEWDLLDIPNAETKALIIHRFYQNRGAKYDWFSLLAFVLPWNIRDSSRFYCYEWCWYAITGINPIGRVTPEDLLVLVSSK
jgi:hypothetical protein